MSQGRAAITVYATERRACDCLQLRMGIKLQPALAAVPLLSVALCFLRCRRVHLLACCGRRGESSSVVSWAHGPVQLCVGQYIFWLSHTAGSPTLHLWALPHCSALTQSGLWPQALLEAAGILQCSLVTQQPTSTQSHRLACGRGGGVLCELKAAGRVGPRPWRLVDHAVVYPEPPALHVLQVQPQRDRNARERQLQGRAAGPVSGTRPVSGG